jgi:hypothetical protein
MQHLAADVILGDYFSLLRAYTRVTSMPAKLISVVKLTAIKPSTKRGKADHQHKKPGAAIKRPIPHSPLCLWCFSVISMKDFLYDDRRS